MAHTAFCINWNQLNETRLPAVCIWGGAWERQWLQRCSGFCPWKLSGHESPCWCVNLKTEDSHVAIKISKNLYNIKPIHVTGTACSLFLNFFNDMQLRSDAWRCWKYRCLTWTETPYCILHLHLYSWSLQFSESLQFTNCKTLMPKINLFPASINDTTNIC